MSYQPYPISAFKTGLYQYLEPWLRPEDAFEPLENAYIYRGSLNKRPGYEIIGNQSAIGAGRMFYKDYLQAGSASVGPYTGSIQTVPIVPGSITITAGAQTVTDNGAGGWSGGIVGTINYTTGAYSITFSGSVSATTGIYAAYAFTISRPIMGLKTWINPLNAQTKLLAFDTRRVCIFNDGTEKFDPLNGIVQTIYQGNGSTTTITLQTGWAAVAPYARGLAPFSISITDGTSTITDDGAGNLSASGNFAAGGTVNYASGAVALNFTVAPAITVFITMTATAAGSYFTGTLQNFFNAVNWKPTTTSYLYCTNNIDRITLFNGDNSSLARPAFPITASQKTSYTNGILACIDLDVYKNRLLVHRPITTDSTPNPEGQTIRFSKQFDATNLVADVAGNGGALVFPTQDFIMGGEFLRDQMLVFFKNSVWSMQPTSLAIRPFSAIQINSTRSTNCPYAMIPYDQRVTSIGSKGIIACDGVNTQRFDDNIIDQFLDISPLAYNQCFSQRFDNLNQSWTLYPSLAQSGSGANATSDKVLVYNYLENTWATYDIALSCLGLYQVTHDATWASFAVGGLDPKSWNEAEFPWNSYLNQKGSPDLIGGGHDGTVYALSSDTDDDNGSSYDCDILSTLWNPFAKQGQAIELGYIDIYYAVNTDVTLNLYFFVNGESNYCETRSINLSPSLSGNNSQLGNFQRVYVNLRAQFVQMEIKTDTSTNGIFQIQGIILWAKPAGRLQAGYTLV